LGDFLAGEAKPRDVLRSVDLDGEAEKVLPVIPAGLDVRHPGDLISSKALPAFLTQIARAYEVVVLDCPPLLPVGDTLDVLPLVDGVLVCVRLGQTTRGQADAAVSILERLPSRPTGLVITGLDSSGSDDYYGYYSNQRLPTPN
jgi:Mrp family chromosome partitioning ATPase